MLDHVARAAQKELRGMDPNFAMRAAHCAKGIEHLRTLSSHPAWGKMLDEVEKTGLPTGFVTDLVIDAEVLNNKYFDLDPSTGFDWILYENGTNIVQNNPDQTSHLMGLGPGRRLYVWDGEELRRVK